MEKGYKNKMMSSEFKDIDLVCVEVECKSPFVFTAGEQQFFKEKELSHAPTRCQDCRNRRKIARLKEGNY